MTYKDKYLKYKLKYLNLKKKLYGGANEEVMEEPIKKSSYSTLIIDKWQESGILPDLLNDFISTKDKIVCKDLIEIYDIIIVLNNENIEISEDKIRRIIMPYYENSDSDEEEQEDPQCKKKLEL